MDRRYIYRALASTVIVVAVIEVYKISTIGEEPHDKIFEWAAYIGSVAGINHSEEWQGVSKSGDKLPKNIAIAIFPFIYGEESNGMPYRN